MIWTSLNLLIADASFVIKASFSRLLLKLNAKIIRKTGKDWGEETSIFYRDTSKDKYNDMTDT